MLEKFKTNCKIAVEVLRGRAMPETLIPRKRNHVEIEIIRVDGTHEKVEGWNSRVNAGALWQADVMGSAAGAPALYIALSSAVLTPAAGDTTLASEITSGVNTGLVRTAGTFQNYTAPGSLGGAASYQITNTFTSAASTTVNSAALFNASSVGSLFVEANLSPAATLANGDQLVLVWTINI